MQATTKSPVRHTAESQADNAALRNRIGGLFHTLLPLLTVALCLWVIALFQWAWLLQGLGPDPVYPTAIAAAFTVFTIVRSWSVFKSLGESPAVADNALAVGEFLDGLRGLGYRVFHGVPADGGDIDHVLISTHGVYMISTVTRSRPGKKPGTAYYDGRAISFANGPSDESPVAASKAQAKQLRRLLNELADNDFAVRPIILLPGWHVESLESDSFADVWALEPRALPMWVNNQPDTVHGREVKHAASSLAAYLKSFN